MWVTWQEDRMRLLLDQLFVDDIDDLTVYKVPMGPHLRLMWLLMGPLTGPPMSRLTAYKVYRTMGPPHPT